MEYSFEDRMFKNITTTWTIEYTSMTNFDPFDQPLKRITAPPNVQ